MTRSEKCAALGYSVPPASVKRVIVDTDAKNEADDQYAIIHHLLSPSLEVKGIIASHFESKAAEPGTTMERSYQEVLHLMKLAEIDDVPVLRGCTLPIGNGAEESEGVSFLIEEARRDDPRPLYVAVQGTMTNVAAALRRAPDIASKLVVIWNGGGPYPHGRMEFNLMQDVEACRVLLESEAEVWQIHQDVYSGMEVSLAELSLKVRPCGALGAYLVKQLEEENHREYNPYFLLRMGENWTLGDNTTVAVLLENQFRGDWHMEQAPIIRDDMTYEPNPQGKMIRVYDRLDVRLTLEDLFAKLALVYGPKAF